MVCTEPYDTKTYFDQEFTVPLSSVTPNLPNGLGMLSSINVITDGEGMHCALLIFTWYV